MERFLSPSLGTEQKSAGPGHWRAAMAIALGVGCIAALTGWYLLTG